YPPGLGSDHKMQAWQPSTGDSVHTIIYKHIFVTPAPPSAKRTGIPGSLTVAISRALSKEPDQRFATMAEFATAVWPEQPVAVPAKGRSAARPRPRAAADAPTEITGAPTTPLPGVKMPKPRPAQAAPKLRSRAPTVVALVVVAAGVGGYLFLGRGGSGERGAVPPAPGPAPAGAA